eukprot:g11410.t1
MATVKTVQDGRYYAAKTKMNGTKARIKKLRYPPFKICRINAKTTNEAMYFHDSKNSNVNHKLQAAESVFTTNLFSSKLCNDIIAASEDYANSRKNEYYSVWRTLCQGDVVDKNGWSTARHSHAPTTDIQFEMLKQSDPKVYNRAMTRLGLLKTKLAIEILNILPRRIDMDDIFVVKYEAGKKGSQDFLMKHRDGSIVTFNILLSNTADFEGGGTALFEPYNTDIHLQQGDCLSHYGLLSHAGKKITKGSRYVLVVFMEIEDFEIHHSWEMPCSLSIDCCTIC